MLKKLDLKFFSKLKCFAFYSKQKKTYHGYSEYNDFVISKMKKDMVRNKIKLNVLRKFKYERSFFIV